MVQQEDMDKVDTLRYLWQNVRHGCVQVQDHLIRVQSSFKASLLTNASVYRQDVASFVHDYAEVRVWGLGRWGGGGVHRPNRGKSELKGLGTRKVDRTINNRGKSELKGLGTGKVDRAIN